MHQNAWAGLAFPGVAGLISFLAYGSQLLFRHIEPYALSQKQSLIFNTLVGCIWISYFRACFTNPGWVPPTWSLDQSDRSAPEQSSASKRTPKWCRKCEAFKPPRAHHCKICSRCVPKMDHHCPWTINCVSHRTFPHFFRFLFYATASMLYLEYFLCLRMAVLWAGRNLPSYLGPTPAQLVYLFILCIVNSITLFALAIHLIRTIWCLGGNVTTIEGWEIERHKTVVRRARVRGGYVDGPDGIRVKIRRQEFPYDIGILQNMRQGMGSPLLTCLWPFTATPSNETGLEFETNGFEDPSLSWPPPDPDRMPRSRIRPSYQEPFVYGGVSSLTIQDDVDAFHKRQEEDLKRYNYGVTSPLRRRPLPEQDSKVCYQDNIAPSQSAENDGLGSDGDGWRNSDGDRLDDFGVDEHTEGCDEDDMPLAELLRRRHATTDWNDGH